MKINTEIKDCGNWEIRTTEDGSLYYGFLQKRNGSCYTTDKSYLIEKVKNDIIDIPTLIERAKQFADNKKSDVLLVLNYRLSINDSSIIKIVEFNRSIVPDEKFYLYLMKK